jgi:hypothetical protein
VRSDGYSKRREAGASNNGRAKTQKDVFERTVLDVSGNAGTCRGRLPPKWIDPFVLEIAACPSQSKYPLTSANSVSELALNLAYDGS